MASQAKFLDFIDMIDGGGRGRMGDTFEGGGIFSALANLLATPYGSEDEARRASREAFLRSRGLLDDPAVASAAQSAAAPAMTGPTRAQRMSAAAAEMARQRGLAQDALDPRGPNQMNVPAARPASGMQFGQQPAGALPSMSFGQQPAGSMPSMSFGQKPAGSMPAAANPFTGPTYDMPTARTLEPSMSNVTRPSEFQNVFSLFDFGESPAARQAVASFYRYADAAGIPKTEENFARYQIEMY